MNRNTQAIFFLFFKTIPLQKQISIYFSIIQLTRERKNKGDVNDSVYLFKF